MRKRAKQRIPQDILPWARVTQYNDDTINIFSKKTTNWFSGNRRKLATSRLAFYVKKQAAITTLKTLTDDMRLGLINIDYHTSNQLHSYKLSDYKGTANVKNFCLFLGKGRTFNRQYQVSRLTLRKLARTGLIKGLQKK